MYDILSIYREIPPVECHSTPLLLSQHRLITHICDVIWRQPGPVSFIQTYFFLFASVIFMLNRILLLFASVVFKLPKISNLNLCNNIHVMIVFIVFLVTNSWKIICPDFSVHQVVGGISVWPDYLQTTLQSDIFNLHILFDGINECDLDRISSTKFPRSPNIKTRAWKLNIKSIPVWRVCISRKACLVLSVTSGPLGTWAPPQYKDDISRYGDFPW